MLIKSSQVGENDSLVSLLQINESLYGVEGHGRSAIISYLKSLTPQPSLQAAVVYAYCDHRLQESQTLRCLLASFLQQLLELYWENSEKVCAFFISYGAHDSFSVSFQSLLLAEPYHYSRFVTNCARFEIPEAMQTAYDLHLKVKTSPSIAEYVTMLKSSIACFSRVFKSLMG